MLIAKRNRFLETIQYFYQNWVLSTLFHDVRSGAEGVSKSR